MARNRRTPPLFEVMRETDPTRRNIRVNPPAVPPSPPPVSRPVPATDGRPPLTLRHPAEEAASEPAFHEPASPAIGPGASSAPTGAPIFDLNRNFTVSARVLLLGVGILLVVFVIGWYGLYRLGADHAKERLLSTIESPTPPVVRDSGPTLDPLVAAPGLAADRRTDAGPRPSEPIPPQATLSRSTQQAASPPTQRSSPPAAPAADTAPGGELAPTVPGWEPRKPNHNYLVVKTIQRQADAEATAEFLIANGVPASAVPLSRVESTGAPAKDSKWQIIVLEGIPSPLRRSDPAISAIEEKVKRIGREWAKDPRGGFHFEDCYWAMYRPKN